MEAAVENQAQIAHATSDADPFSKQYFDDPYPVQAALRDSGAAVWLTR